MHAHSSKNIIRNAFWRTLIVMTVSELASSLAVMIDGMIFVRFFGGLSIAAHGLTLPYVNLVKLLGGFFAVGTQVACSASIGRSDLDGANRTFSYVFAILIALTAVLTVFMTSCSEMFADLLGATEETGLHWQTNAYFRGLAFGLPFTVGTMTLIPVVALNGDKKAVTAATTTMMVVNLAGDLLNVFVFHLEMFGMGLTTSVSYVCSFAILLFHFRKKSGICFDFSRRIRLKELAEAGKAGLLPSFTRACSFVKSYLVNMIYLAYAGTVALAANSLIQSNVKVVLICLATAIGQTTLIMSGFLFGEEDKRGMIQMYKTVIRISFGTCAVLAAAVFVCAPWILSVFSLEGELNSLAIQALRVFIVGFPLIGIKMFYINYFQSIHNSRMSYLSSVLGELVFITLTTFLFLRWFGTFGLWMAYPVSELLYLITVFAVCCVRLRRIPTKLEDLLFLPANFDAPEEDKLDCMIWSTEEIPALSDDTWQFCIDHGVPERKSYYISLAVEELAHNIFQHGMDDGKKHFVDLKIIRKDGFIKMRLRDDCRTFNPKEKAAMLPKDKSGKGIGLRMVFSAASSVDYMQIEYVSVLNLNNILVEITDHA